MGFRLTPRASRLSGLGRLGAGLLAAVIGIHGAWAEARAQGGWRPDGTVEIVTSSAAGGGNDRIAHLIQRTIQSKRLLAVPVLVVNRPGRSRSFGSSLVAATPGNAHRLLLANPTLLSNYINGGASVGYTDLTPIATLLSEQTVFSVSIASPVPSVRALMEEVRGDPESVAFGIVSRGGSNHLALAKAVRAAGIDPTRLKIVEFRSSAESLSALAEGEIRAAVTSLSAALGPARAERTRMIAIASPLRLGGRLADLPTLREEGIDATVESWRAVFGPGGLTPQQVAGWEDVLAAVVESFEWKRSLARYRWTANFQRSRETAAYLDKAYADTRALMVELGLAK